MLEIIKSSKFVVYLKNYIFVQNLIIMKTQFTQFISVKIQAFEIMNSCYCCC